MTHNISNIIDLANAPNPPRWFEFLLEPNRLREHLETSVCDPSPTELIALFFRNVPTISLLQPETTTTTTPPTIATTNGGSQSSNQKVADSQAVPTIPSTNGHSNSTHDDNKNVSDKLLDKLVVDFVPVAADQSPPSPSLSPSPALAATAHETVHIPPDSYEAKYRARKAYALQTLAIKVASFIKWDLNLICNNLTIPIQYKLMQSLNLACSSAEDCPLEVKKFSNIIYCHWFLKSAISYQLSNLQPQLNNTTIIYLSQLQQQQQAAESNALFSMGELFSPSSKLLKTCTDDLHTYIRELSQARDDRPKKMRANTANHPFKTAKLSVPLMDCFNSKDDQANDWTKCIPIDSKEFIESACYDLGRFFFFGESYKLAKESFEILKDSNCDRFPKLKEYLQSSNDMLSPNIVVKLEKDVMLTSSDNNHRSSAMNNSSTDYNHRAINKRKLTEKYLFDCMTKFIKNPSIDEDNIKVEFDAEMIENTIKGEDSDLRIGQQQQQHINPWEMHIPTTIQEHQLFETTRGDNFMSHGDFKQAMGCYIGALMLMTDYFRIFSKSYIDEEPYIMKMIQCSISLSCFTQAVAFCQMTRTLNYTIAFKQLNERVCNDCCDDIYECIWNVTLLEYIINLHSKRGEVERRTKVIQLIGQLELNENNPEDILKEAEHVRRGKFFRILSNKYL